MLAHKLKQAVFLLITAFSCLLLHSDLMSQSQVTLNNIEKLNRAKSVEERANLFNYISFDLREEGFYNQARAFADSALHISKNIDNKEGLATAYRRIGEIYDDTFQQKLAISYYDSAYRLSEAIGDLGGQARAANQLCLTLNRLGSYNNAIEYGHLAIDYFQIDKDNKGIALAMNNLANAYSSIAEYDSSIIYFNKALATAIIQEDSAAIADIYLNLGVVYHRLSNYDKAIEYSSMSQAIADQNEGLYFRELEAKAMSNQGNSFHKLKDYNKAELLFLKARDIKLNNGMAGKIAPELNGLGLIAITKGDLEKAEALYEESFELRKKQGNANTYISLLNLGKVMEMKGNSKKSIQFLEQALQQIDSLGIIYRNPEVLLNLSNLYAQIEDTEQALIYSLRYAKVRDDIITDLIRLDSIEEDIAKTRRELDQAEVTKIQEQLKTRQLWIVIIALIVILGLSAFTFYTKNKNSRLKAANLQKDKEQAEQDKKINTLIKSQEINTISARMEGQERERTRIAQDLHDRLGGMLSVVRLNFQSFEESLEAMKEKNIKQFTQASELLNEACEEVRRIAHDMTSGVLVDFGLVAAITDLKTAVESSEGLKVNLNEYGMGDRLEYDYEINAYRIIQELLTNTLKHAQANEINIQLLRDGDELSIVVDDDGQGFDPESISEEGMGLSGIKNRVAQFDGTISIDSGKGAGTTVTIELPIKIAVL